MVLGCLSFKPYASAGDSTLRTWKAHSCEFVCCCFEVVAALQQNLKRGLAVQDAAEFWSVSALVNPQYKTKAMNPAL